MLGIVGTEGEQRSHLLRYYAQSVGGRDFNGNVYAGTDAYQQMNGRRVGKALFDETPVEWGGSSAAIHLLDEMIGLSPEYASALGAARDTYQALREGRNAQVNAQLLQDAQDFGVFYAITGAATLASGGLALGIGAAGLTGTSAIAAGAGGEALISIAAGSATRAYSGSEISGSTIAFDGTVGLVLGGIGGRVVGGPRSVAIGESGGTARFTFRGDSRGPNIIFNQGFAPRGNSTDLLAHALDNTRPPSAYVSTSKSFDVAAGFADNVYVVRSTNGIDVNRVLGPASPYPRELEIAIPGRVTPGNVVAITLPKRGISVLNPNYRP